MDWLFEVFLLIPGLMEPQELLIPLLAGAACLGIGVVILRRNLLGILSLFKGAVRMICFS